MTPLISVIVPVYNVEKFLEKSIRSLMAQSYSNIEIILVDDGSPDASGEICDMLSNEDSRVKVIHKNNGGVSSARNAGIEASEGAFICFIDGDDYVAENYVEDMYNTLVKYDVDISTINQYKIWSDGKTEELYPHKPGTLFVKTGIETLSDMLYGKTCYATCCCKLYKKEIFDDIRFPVYSMGEDSYTMYSCFIKAKKVAHLYKPSYYYIQHSESAMHTENYDKFYDYIELSDNFIERVNNGYPELFLPAVNRLIENNFWVYMKMRKTPDKYKHELEHITENIKKYRGYAIKDKNVCARTRLACLLSYLGMNTLNKVYDNFAK